MYQGYKQRPPEDKPNQPRRPVIRTARLSEARALTDTAVAAYSDVPLCQYLTPKVSHRRGMLTGYVRIFVTHALKHGHVEVLDGKSVPLAVAGWLPSTAPAVPDDFAEQVARVSGMWSVRFDALHAQLAQVHAHGHRRLVFLAALPGVQGHGLGSTLLAHHLDHLDSRGIAACLETTSPRSVDFYARHDFTPHGNPIEVAAEPGCVLTAMRRPPRLPASIAATTRTVPPPP